MRLLISWLLKMYQRIQTNMRSPQHIWATISIDMGCTIHFSFLNITILLIGATLGSVINIQKSYAVQNTNSQLMGKSYVNFYSQFLSQKLEMNIKELEESKIKSEKIKNKQDAIYSYLGLFSKAIDCELDLYAKIAINYIKKNKRTMDKHQGEIFTILYGRYYNQKKDYAASVLKLKPIAHNSQSVYFSIISTTYMDSLSRLNLSAEAIDYFSKYNKIIEKNMGWEQLNEILVLLSEGAIRYNKHNLALTYLKKPLLFFPIEESGRKAMRFLSQVECSGGSLGSLYYREENMLYLTREIFRRVGKLSESRDFILSLIGVNPSQVLPSKDIDSLSLKEKEQLLDKVEMLVSAREYYLAHQILDYILGAKIYSESFSRDKILDYRGRVFNALELPLKASQSYRELFVEYPMSKLADSAKVKYSISLHLARRYSDAAQFVSSTKVFSSKEDQSWFVFWEYYLAEKKEEAEKVAQNYLAQKNSTGTPKFIYWLSVQAKKRSVLAMKKGEILKISQLTSDYPYPIFARWNLENNKKLPVFFEGDFFYGFNDYYIIQKNPFIKNKINQQKLEVIRKLSLFDLHDFARLRINLALSGKIKKKEAVILANLAYSAKDFKTASDLVRTFFPHNLEDYQPEAIWTQKTNFWKLNFPLAYWKEVLSVSKLLNLDPFWILSIMRAESWYLPYVESSVGAIGLMQIMPYTGINIAKNIGKKDFNMGLLKRPEESIAFAGWYLKMLLTIYKGNYVLATAAYNAGPEAVNRWINHGNRLKIDEFYENIPYQETKKYVAKVLGYLDIYYRVQLGIGDGYNLDFAESLPEPNTNLDIF